MAKKTPNIQLTTYEDILGIGSSELDSKLHKIHISELYDGKFQYRDKNKTPEEIREEAINLSVSIEMAGKVIEKPIVRKLADHRYEIISGHTRVRACRYLAEEVGKKEFEYVECYVEEMTDEEADYNTAAANVRKPTTEAELLHEIEKERERAYKVKDPNVRGRLVEQLATKYGRSKSTIGEYITISKNLSDKAREAFDSEVINKSAAVTMASLSHEEQDKLVDAGVTRQKDIKAYKEAQVEKTVHRTTVTDTVKTTKTHMVEDTAGDIADETINAVEVLPGQYRVANTEMDLEEVSITENASEEEYCTCPNCQKRVQVADTYVFYNKRYCIANCLADLITDLADTGVINLDFTSQGINGIIVRS